VLDALAACLTFGTIDNHCAVAQVYFVCVFVFVFAPKISTLETLVCEYDHVPRGPQPLGDLLQFKTPLDTADSGSCTTLMYHPVALLHVAMLFTPLMPVPHY
jgi:hypothetical protein